MHCTPDTPIAPMTLLSETIGTPPSATLAPNVSTRSPTPPPATASSNTLVARRNSAAVRAFCSAMRTDESCALSSRCCITRLAPESTMAMATPQLFRVAQASAAAIAFLAASIEIGGP
jgi:hypothetical protein